MFSQQRFALTQQRLDRNRQCAKRNTQGEYLLRRLLSCGRCGLAHGVWNNGRYAYYRCKGMDVLVMRGRRKPGRARQIPTDRLDPLVWADVCAVLSEPTVLQDALHRAHAGNLSGDERAAQLRDLHRRMVQLERQIQRLVDAYEAEALTLDELRARRARLEERLAGLRRDEQRHRAESSREAQVEVVAGRIEEFRAAVAQGLEHATFAQKRALVELLIERVIVDAPDMEIRYVIPLSGLARRNGVLRPRHFERVVGPDLSPVLWWERQIRQHLVLGLVQQLSHAREARPQLIGHTAPLLTSGGGIRLDEHGADRGRDHLLGAFGHQAQRISHEMRAASLPAGALEDRGDGAFETLVAIADHQLHASQTTRHPSAQEAQPEGAVLTGSDIHPEHFALAGRRIEPDRDDDRPVHHAVILPLFQVGGVVPTVRIDLIEFVGEVSL